MSSIVTVKFKKARDYSNENKDRIIFTLPAYYRVSRDDLNVMDKGGSYAFEFKGEEAASKFAMKLFSKNNDIFDITTNSIFQFRNESERRVLNLSKLTLFWFGLVDRCFFVLPC